MFVQLKRVPIRVRDPRRYKVGGRYHIANTGTGEILSVEVVDIVGYLVTFAMAAVGEA